jgi:hypothetical protein
MQTKSLTLFCLTSCLLTQVACANVKRTLNVQATVRGEQSMPLEGAEFKAIFWGGLPKDDVIKTVLTDEDGLAEVSGRTEFNPKFFFMKEGYYQTKYEKYSWERPESLAEQLVQIELNVTLRPVVDPQPLVARKNEFTIPKTNEWIGFDLEISDWVMPHGEGKSSDLLIYHEKEFLGYNISQSGLEKVRAREARLNAVWTEEMEKEIYGNWSGNLKIGFPGEDEGIIEVVSEYDPYSAMRMPYEAPMVGYQPSLEWTDVVYRAGEPEAKGYFLRVRVKKRGDEIIQANYAKINEGIQFNPGRNRIIFSYCFNPEINDRNLEFDTDKNLLEIDDITERVILP